MSDPPAISANASCDGIDFLYAAGITFYCKSGSKHGNCVMSIFYFKEKLISLRQNSILTDKYEKNNEKLQVKGNAPNGSIT